MVYLFQGEEHGAGLESEANVGEQPEISEDNDRDTSSQAEHTEEPGVSVRTFVFLISRVRISNDCFRHHKIEYIADEVDNYCHRLMREMYPM